MVKAEEVQQQRQKKVAESTLDSLLAWDGTIDVRETLGFPALGGGRPGMKVVIRSISSDEYQECDERATMSGVGRNGQTLKELDYQQYKKFVLFKAIVSPDLSNPMLQNQHNQGNHEVMIVDKMFLPGEQDKMMNKVATLSGYPDGNEIEMKAKSDTDLS